MYLITDLCLWKAGFSVFLLLCEVREAVTLRLECLVWWWTLNFLKFREFAG